MSRVGETTTAARHLVRVALVALAAAVILVAISSRGSGDLPDLGRSSDPRLPPATASTSTGAAPESSSSSNEPGLVRTRTESPAAVVEEPGYHRVRILVRCEDGTPIESAVVTLGSMGRAEYWQSETTGEDGRALLRTPTRIGPRESLVVRAMLPGAMVEQPLAGLEPGAEVELVFDAIGWLEARIDGEFAGAGMQVVALVGGETSGATCTRTFDAPSERMAVALGLEFRVLGWQGGERKSHTPLRGPEQPRAVVPLDFDFRRCRVSFRLPAGSEGAELVAMQVTKRKCTRCDIVRGDDGTSTVLVPLAAEAWFVLARKSESFEVGPLAFTADVDLGLVRLEPMATAGVVEARHTDGALAYGKQAPSAFLFPTGEVLRASMSTSALFAAEPDALGTRLATLRLFAGLAVRPSDYEHFSEPAEVVLRDGAIARATLHRGAVLNLVATAEGKLATSWLEHATTKERVRSSRAWFEEGRVPAWRFERLAPGDYEVRIEDAEVSPPRVTVTAGSTQRVAIQVTHR